MAHRSPLPSGARFRTVLRTAVLAALVGLVAPPTLRGQAADPVDVSTLDGIVAAVYDVISGPAGQPRDWNRWHSLFAPGARLIPVGRSADGAVTHRLLTPENYATTSGPRLEEMGFFEVEVHRVTESYGQIAHLFSTYESRRNAADAEPFARGINSFQLLNDGARWWVLSILWDAERPESPIPSRYLGG